MPKPVDREGTVFPPDNSPAKERISLGIPNHVLIIPDNNRTWARENGLTVQQGYGEFGKRIVGIAEKAAEINGLDHLTIHIASLDNIQKRPEEEKAAFWQALQTTLIADGLPKLTSQNVKFQVLGRMDKIPSTLAKNFTDLVESSKENTGLSLNFVIGYDHNQEKEDALKAAQAAGEEPFNWEAAKKYLYLAQAGLPDVSALIRTGKQMRTSAIFPEGIANAEIDFNNITSWPEYTPEMFEAAITLISRREIKGGK